MQKDGSEERKTNGLLHTGKCSSEKKGFYPEPHLRISSFPVHVMQVEQAEL